MTYTSIPNALTVMRIAFAPLIVALMSFDSVGYCAAAAGCLFLAAAATDWLDGRLARAWGCESELGRALDPVADKALVAAAVLAAAAAGTAWDVVVVGAAAVMTRDFAVSAIRERVAARGLVLRVTEAAKFKTALQMAGAAFLLAGHPAVAGQAAAFVGNALFLVSAVAAVATGAAYVRAASRMLAAPNPSV